MARGLKERYTDFLYSFTFDNISQLDQDVSTASAAIREWRNTFVPINRVPLDILSLIPAHLASQKDRFRASFVCRHWRRTFLQRATLWSELYLSMGEAYVKTLLGRAKGSMLDIFAGHTKSLGYVVDLRSHTKQIGYLDFSYHYWKNIQRFSEVNSGPFPLLHTLRIDAVSEFDLNGPDVMTPPSLPLFSTAVNLKDFLLYSEGSPFINHFVFPKLTTFQLSAVPEEEEFHASQLLDFLEASPMLRTVHMKVIGDILLQGIPRERVVVLPDVETFSLVVSEGGPGYEVATHISCPSVRNMTLIHDKVAHDALPEEIFPALISWNTIARQYARAPIEEVALEINLFNDPLITCSVTFRSPDATVLRLVFKVAASDDDEDEEDQMNFLDVHYGAFSQASRTIRNHPHLASVKRLCIHHRAILSHSDQLTRTANEVGLLFKSMGPLEELSLEYCDIQAYLRPLLSSQEHHDMEQHAVFPPVKEFRITHPSMAHNSRGACMETIVEFAKSRHELGVPFERLTICMERLPAAMAEKLGPWVGVVDCYEEIKVDFDP